MRMTPAILGACFAVAPLSVAAQRPVAPRPVSPRPTADAASVARAIAAQLLETAHLPGLSVAISHNGTVVFAEGFGFADIEQRAPVTTTTRFRTGSVGKIITATALGRLMQERRVDLDAAVQRYVPDYPATQWPLTARDLAGHVSGISHYSATDRIESRFYPSVSDALRVFSHQAPREAPRTTYRYSTHGYTLLSAIIEGAAQKPFLEYLRESVTTPLGMTSTGPDLRATPDKALATFYRWANNALTRVATPEDPSYKWAGGGLTSTPRDLLRLADGYANGFLSATTVDAMWSSQRLADGRETGVGLGWRVGRDMGGRRVIEHAGSMQGTRAVLSIFRDDHLAIAIMTNREWSSNIEETAHMLALPFMTATPVNAATTVSKPVTVEQISGSSVTTTGGQLSLRDGRGTLQLAPGTERAVSYPLIRVADDGVYAMVTPDGVYHLTLHGTGDALVGSAVAYGSPRTTPPTNNPPFLRFTAAK